MTADAYYERLEEPTVVDGVYRGTWQPTTYASGAWQPGEQHMGPVSGLLVHAVEDFLRVRDGGDHDFSISRISFDILGMISEAPTTVEVSVRRPGRTIELLEATVTTGQRPSVSARVWRLASSDTTRIAGGQPDPMPSPDAWPDTAAFGVWQGGFITSLEARVEPGAEPGRTRAWLRPNVDLVAGHPSSELARFIGVVDGANGIAVRVRPQEWLFPNVDLTVHLFRQPIGPWVGFDTRVVFGPDGAGLTTSTLHDVRGPVGRAEQILTLRALKP